MSIHWDWIVLIILVAGMGFGAWKYYKGQAAKYRDGGHNTDMDKFRDGGCCGK